MRFIYRGRIAVFSVKVSCDWRRLRSRDLVLTSDWPAGAAGREDLRGGGAEAGLQRGGELPVDVQSPAGWATNFL